MELNTKEKLQNLFNEGLVQEIFVADESYFILQTIRKKWSQISKNNLGVFFKSLYHAHFIRYSLSITKLYDKTHSKYDIISLPSVLKFISDNLIETQITNKPLTAEWLYKKGYNYNKIIELSDKELLSLIIEHFDKEIPTGDYTGNLFLERSLESIKFYRDKVYAHREDISRDYLPKSTFEDGQSLLKFAKFFVTIFELVIFNAGYSDDGENYILERDSTVTNNAFLRLLEKSSLIQRKDDYDDFDEE